MRCDIRAASQPPFFIRFRVRFKPTAESRQPPTEQSFSFRAIERGVRGARRPGIVLQGSGLQVRIELRPARRKKIADPPAGKTPAPAQMIKTARAVSIEL